MDHEIYSQDCANFLQKLIQTPSVNGEQNERQIIDVIIAEAEKLGLPYQVIENEPGRPNLFVGEGFSDESGLLMVAHADTVPVGDANKWEYGPFSGEIVDGKIYGRGALDCKGGIATSVYALKALYDQDKGLLAKILIGADEESGADSKFGIRAVLEAGLKAEGAIYTYGGRIENELIIGHRGLIRAWIICRGESAHSGSLQWQQGKKGSSAINGILQFVKVTEEIGTDTQSEYFPDYETVVTPTLIEGGEGESLVPSAAKVLLDIRTLPGDNEAVLGQVQDKINALSTDKHVYEIEMKNNIPAVISDPASKVVQAAIQVKGDVYGYHEPSLRGSGPANEAYMLVEAGIPTVVGFGPSGEGFHSANEYADLDSLQKSLQALIDLSNRMAT